MSEGYLLTGGLLRKLEKEKEYFLIRGELIQEEIEEKRVKVMDMEMHLRELKRDLARSRSIIDLLRDNEN